MGFPNIFYIAPAILYMNPGLTRDEYFSLLDKTHGSSHAMYFGEESSRIPLTHFDPKDEDNQFHSLCGLASLLNIGYSEEYKEIFQKTVRDENGLNIKPPYYIPNYPEKGQFSVHVHEGNKVGTEIQMTFYALKGLKPGTADHFTVAGNDTLAESLMRQMMGENSVLARVERINSGKFVGLWGEYGSKSAMYKYTAELRPFERVKRIEIYPSEEGLFRNWPVLKAENMYAWYKEKGGFTNFIGTLDGFEWHKRDEKYYLDDKLLDKISATGYRELLLTVDAIKEGVWKPLSYKGYQWWGQFLHEYSRVRENFEIAGYFSQHSLSAKHEGITTTEFLRRMILGGNHYSDFYSKNSDIDL